MDASILWNLNWKFCEGFSESYLYEDAPEAKTVHLPHTVKELPLSCFSHSAAAMISTYTKELEITPQMEERRIFLTFDGVMTYFELFVNGKRAGEHKGGYSRSRFDITSLCHAGKNRVTVRVDSHEREDIPPFGYAIDYLTFGGIYRDVWLDICSHTVITQALIRYDLTEGEALLSPELILDHQGEPIQAVAELSLRDTNGHEIFAYEDTLSVHPGTQSLSLRQEAFANPILWNPDAPYLYTVEITLTAAGNTLDRHQVKTGFRTVDCRHDGLFINGRKWKIMGLNRHQSFPYVGYAMGKRAQETDADILKDFLGVNAVRTSHYMQSEYFLNRCDEIGLLVFSEIPGWGHIGGEEFKKVMLQDVESMITTQYNHPSIFIWSVRINESLDDDELYQKANDLAHRLDSSRPTTGVRYISNSHLLEDVYSLNDFTYSDCDPEGLKLFRGRKEATGLNEPVPFLISEFAGTAFPTKLWDTAYKRTVHARAYARIFSQSNLSPEMLGTFGWCAFDYNTHGDYGSGDKICYHGVMDMFRIPKYAAYLLRSQKDPEETIVMEATTEFSRGDNQGNKLSAPFMILTNCDYVEIEMYGREPVRYYPDSRYIGLAHPPIEVEEEIGVWQDLWQDGQIIGYYKGRPAATKRFLRDSFLDDLEVTADDRSLWGDYVDTTRIVCRVKDSADTTLVYYHGVIQVKTQGNLQIIDPDIIPIHGGYAAFWVKTKPEAFSGKGEAASVTIGMPGAEVEEKEIQMELKPSGWRVG